MGRVVLSIAFIMFYFNTNAQYFDAGVKAGFAGTQVDGDEYVGYTKMGLVLGVFVNRDFSNKSTFQLGMNYFEKGSKKNINAEKCDFTFYKMSLKYLDIPLLYKHSINSDIKIETGLSCGILVDSKEFDEYGEILDQQEFNKYEYSYIAGVEYMLNDKFSVNANYIYTIFFHPIYTFSSNKKQFNNVIALTLSYHFNN